MGKAEYMVNQDSSDPSTALWTVANPEESCPVSCIISSMITQDPGQDPSCRIFVRILNKIVVKTWDHAGSFRIMDKILQDPMEGKGNGWFVLIYLVLLSCRIMFVPKRVPHPNIIAFTEKVTNLEPEISPYFCKCINH